MAAGPHSRLAVAFSGRVCLLLIQALHLNLAPSYGHLRPLRPSGLVIIDGNKNRSKEVAGNACYGSAAGVVRASKYSFGGMAVGSGGMGELKSKPKSTTKPKRESGVPIPIKAPTR